MSQWEELHERACLLFVIVAGLRWLPLFLLLVLPSARVHRRSLHVDMRLVTLLERTRRLEVRQRPHLKPGVLSQGQTFPPAFPPFPHREWVVREVPSQAAGIVSKVADYATSFQRVSSPACCAGLRYVAPTYIPKRSLTSRRRPWPSPDQERLLSCGRHGHPSCVFLLVNEVVPSEDPVSTVRPYRNVAR